MTVGIADMAVLYALESQGPTTAKSLSKRIAYSESYIRKVLKRLKSRGATRSKKEVITQATKTVRVNIWSTVKRKHSK